MARIELPSYSMFSATPAYDGIVAEIEGVRQSIIVFGLMVPAVVADASDVLYTIPQAGEGRLDLVSQQWYGVPDLWWVVAVVNNVVDPLTAFPAGTQIRIPTKERLAAEGILNV